MTDNYKKRNKHNITRERPQQFFRRGNGTAIAGIAFLLLITILCLFSMEFFARNERRTTLQTAADTIADSTANYALKHRASYHEARRKAEEYKNDIIRYLEVPITDMEIERAAYRHHIVRVTLTEEVETSDTFMGGAYHLVVQAATKYARGHGAADPDEPPPDEPPDDEEEDEDTEDEE